jgi:hypothetical protein
VVLADSRQISGVRRYSGIRIDRPRVFAYRTLTLYGRPFQTLRLTHDFLTVRPDGSPITAHPTTPNTQRLPAITCARFRLIRFRSPLLTESLLFSLPTGTEMFHFPAFPPHTLYIQVWVTPHDGCRVTPFGNPGITARLTTPPGISQSPTSFIGS